MRALGRTQVRAGTALAAVGFTNAALGSVLVLLARDLAVETRQLSWLASAYGAGLLLVALIGVRLLARGADAVLRAGALLLALGAALLAVTRDSTAVVVGALALGLGAATFVLAVSALLAGHGVARRLAAVNAAASIAGILAPLTLSALDATAGAGRAALLLLVPPLLVLAAVRDHTATTTQPSTPEPGPLHRGEAVRRWTRLVLAVAVEFCFVVWAVARLQLSGLTPAGAVAAATAFPLGMAIGRTAGLRLATTPSALPLSALTTALGTIAVALGGHMALIATGLLLAGLGVALLYPLTLAHLLTSPGLGPARGASAGALATGAAVLLAPLTLAAVADVVDLKLAFLLVLPPLALLARRQKATRPTTPAVAEPRK